MQTYRQILENKFQTIYQALNEQQQKAVDKLEGPVMVIAGPGTGKTQILGARIGKILLETDALPENILCLTYTDAGVVAMRKRLVNFIGAAAYRVNIYTFHAFCNDVIQENLSLFQKNTMDPISELEKVELLKQLIDSFPKGHPLKRYRGDVYYEINNLSALFSDMKKEGWTSAYLFDCIDKYIELLPTQERFIAKRASGQYKKGDVRTDKIAEETEKMEKLRAAVGEFDTFQNMMNSRNRYDFDDMINWVINAFSTHEHLLRNYQERYQYILVDEYQDTSGTQNRLVELLMSYWEQPNVFVVGDDDQSIFRFQGANVENMAEFARQFSNDLITVILSNNYRSTQPILDISKTLINRNEERLVKKMEGLSKDLKAANHDRLPLLHLPKIREYETQKEEMVGVVIELEKLLLQGVQPGRIAVIYRENKYGEEIAQFLKLKNIPYYSKRSVNLFTIPLAQKILTLLRYLNCEHDIAYSGDEMLFELLHFDWFGIPPIEIAKLSIESAETKFTPNKFSLRELLIKKAASPDIDLFTPALGEKLSYAAGTIEKLIAGVSNLTLQQLMALVIKEAGVLSTILQQPDKHWQLQALTALFDFIKEENARNPALNLVQFINIIDLMEKEAIPIPLINVSGNEKGINLLTVHGSKGLEYQYVFFVGSNAGLWETKKNTPKRFTLPETVFSTGAQSLPLEELRRLFYVALTRAEEHLFISYSKFSNSGKEMEPSMFIAEIQEEHPIQVEKVIITQDVLSDFRTLLFTDILLPEIERSEKELMERLLDKFVMNVTALNSYLKCPLQFYYQNLIRIPSPKNESTEFGSAVHFALEQLFRKMQADESEQFGSKENFIADFKWYMKRHRESFTPEQFSRRLEYGETVLSAYYEQYLTQWNKIVSIERNIRGVVVNDVPLKGKLDKLEFTGKDVNVVDYKTGDPEKAIAKLTPPSEKEVNGGDYWRQAVFYKILVENDKQGWNVVSCEFDFIEPTNKKRYQKHRVDITPQDVETVKHQIKMVWDKIMQHNFYTGCGKEDCHWCNFVKTNGMAVHLHEPQEDE